MKAVKCSMHKLLRSTGLPRVPCVKTQKIFHQVLRGFSKDSEPLLLPIIAPLDPNHFCPPVQDLALVFGCSE